MTVKIAPSLLSADFTQLGREVERAEAGGADALHFDIMDGHFVPNITFGPMVVRALRPRSSLPFLVHLMIENPDQYVESFAEAGADAVTVHQEACVHLHRVLEHIRSLGVRAGVALNPSTPLCTIEDILPSIDLLLLMTVNPGFGAQEFIPSVVPKIRRARDMFTAAGQGDTDIEVDGGIGTDTCRTVVEAGANVLIAGNAVFAYPDGVAAAIVRIREALAGLGAGG